MKTPRQHPVSPDISAQSLDPEAIMRGTLSRRQFLLRNLSLFGAVMIGDITGESNLPQITRQRLPIPGLSTPTRVVQLSDLHRSWCVSEDYIARAVATANALHPDLVLVTGDFVTRTSRYAESCARCLGRLQASLGVYGVLGNHDYWCDDFRGAQAVARALDAVNVHLLTNRNTILSNGLYLIGIDDIAAGRPDLRAAFDGVPLDAPRLAMTHNPQLLDRARSLDCVILAGHTHGGQIVFPYITRTIFKPRFGRLSGWWYDPGYPCRMYITRGLGVVNLPFRFGCPPEISVFDLVPA